MCYPLHFSKKGKSQTQLVLSFFTIFTPLSMRPILTIFLLVFLAATAFSQQVLLLSENFESPTNTFAFDTGGITNHSGSNKWIINDAYDGGVIYPATTNQDSTTAGTITNAPFSDYLHIHDENAVTSNSVSNANYDVTAVSDRFAYTSDGFCTLGMKEIILAFFYVCEGSPDAHGEVYYSINGGAWTQTGAAQYRNQTKWNYVTITDPIFENVANLRFGFRWVNGAGTPPSTISFGIDDILVVGTYDQITGPQLTVPFISPNPVCRLSSLVLQWDLSEPLCDGAYRIELSNSSGNFTNPVSLGVFNIADLDTTGFVGVLIPGTTPPGNCYKVRVTRIAPPPVIVGTASICFQVQVCPNTITTLTPIVTTDPDTVCSQSAIDVPFLSTGVFNAPNVYIAQLSDSAGNFANPQIIGTFPSRETYDPAIGAMPGNVSGLIPITPEGCNYFIRVVSTSPATIGTLYGPFCIKHCDITTNETLDISVCIRETVGVTDTVEIDINQWDSSASYLAGNSFIVQLLDMMSLAVVNEGGLGVLFDTTSSTMILTIPGLNDLLLLGIMPGSYYMRIIADNSTNPWNSNGTIIRLTIGAPADNPSLVIPDKSVYCNTEIAELLIVPYNPDSEYEWLSTSLNNGVPFTWPGNTLRVDFTGAPVDDYTFRVREINYGCFGPYSPPKTIFVVSIPDVEITGPTVVCQGDTFLYTVSYLPETYYEWSLSWGRIIDTSNNEIIVTFDSTGTVELSIYALNICGIATNTFNVNVVQVLSVDAGDDKTICVGESVELEATGAGFDKVLETTLLGTSGSNGNMFDVKADYDLTITRFDANFLSNSATDMRIYYRAAPYAGSETDSTSWSLLGSATGITPNPTGTATPIPILINIFIPAGNIFSFYITTTNNTFMVHTNGNVIGGLYASDGILNFYEGTAITYAFSSPITPRVWNGRIHYFTEQGVNYLWSNGDSTAATIVQPIATTNYTIRVSDTTGCGSADAVNVFVNELPPVDAGENDSLLCKGLQLQLNASGADVYTWSPPEGLSDPNSSNPTVIPAESAIYNYYLTGTDTATGCIAYDTVTVAVEGCELMLTIPQAFTPNGDGANDFFTVFGDNIDKYEIRIFNRWGEQVYYSTNSSEVSQGLLNLGWNGEHKGKAQDTGVYVYYIKASKGDATPIERKGNVTLIR